MKKSFVVLIVLLALLFGGCGEKPSSQNPTTESVSVMSTETNSEENTSTTSASLETTVTSENASVQTTSQATTDVSERKVISFLGVADNLIHPNLYDYADAKKGGMNDGEYDFSVFYENIKSYLARTDLKFINQETISGGDELGLSGYPQFNSPRDLIYQLRDLGFNMVNLANNHSLDTGARGIYHALYHWSKTGCTYAGIYTDEEDRARIRVREINGVRFALLGYTSHTNGIASDTPWRVGYMNEEDIRRDVAEAKKVADFVIVSAHWGWDDIFNIDDYQRTYAQLFADVGVDLVVGTGPHLLQHIEWYDRADGSKMLCAFSLGNYCSGMIGPFNELSGMLTLDFVMDGEEKRIENVVMIPLVMHKEANDSYMGVFELSKYTDEMAAKSAVNIYTGGLSIPYFRQVLKEQIADEFLPEEFRQN